MKKDWLAAICAFPSIILEIMAAPIQRLVGEEKQVLEGAEYDPESDYQEENPTTSS